MRIALLSLALAAFLTVAWGAEVSPVKQPDPKLTPGAMLNVTERDVCRRGYAKSVRDVTIETKKQVFALYKTEYVPHAYEVDHEISLELGGSNDIKNLWPQPLVEARMKDLVEDKLHRDVCAGQLSLKEAQYQVIHDWYHIYKQMQDGR